MEGAKEGFEEVFDLVDQVKHTFLELLVPDAIILLRVQVASRSLVERIAEEVLEMIVSAYIFNFCRHVMPLFFSFFPFLAHAPCLLFHPFSLFHSRSLLFSLEV